MHGNVWQWCQDYYGDYAAKAVTNPVGAEGGLFFVFRGGSWKCPASQCRSATRYFDIPGDWRSDVGLRVVRTADEPIPYRGVRIPGRPTKL